jgi:glutathione S-transferase
VLRRIKSDPHRIRAFFFDPLDVHVCAPYPWTSMASALLVTIPFSHYCEKARWALDRAGVGYVEEGHLPGFHRLAVRRTGSAHTSVPVLVVGGRTIGDSTDILAYADAMASAERRLYPEAARARADVLALEEELDEGLGPDFRRVMYFHVLPQRATAMGMFEQSTPRWELWGVRAVFPILRRGMKRFMKIDERTAAESLERVLRVFDAIEKRLADGRSYLAGDRFTAADLTFAALAGGAMKPPEHPIRFPPDDVFPRSLVTLLRETRERPAGAFIRRMYREHRR